MSKNFIEVQQRIIIEIVRQMLIVQSAFQSSFESSNDSKSSNSTELNDFNNNDTFKWNAADFDFFDFFYDEKSADIENVMKHIHKNTYFQNVHFFIERARNVITTKNADLIRKNLWTCFRDTVFTWWIDETSTVEKRFVRHFTADDQLNEWIHLFYFRFKKSSNIVFEAMIKKWYILRDVVNYWKSREYV